MSMFAESLANPWAFQKTPCGRSKGLGPHHYRRNVQDSCISLHICTENGASICGLLLHRTIQNSVWCLDSMIKQASLRFLLTTNSNGDSSYSFEGDQHSRQYHKEVPLLSQLSILNPQLPMHCLGYNISHVYHVVSFFFSAESLYQYELGRLMCCCASQTKSIVANPSFPFCCYLLLQSVEQFCFIPIHYLAWCIPLDYIHVCRTFVNKD